MYTIFDETTREALITRIHMLNEHSVARWGEMNVSQMLRHNVLFEEMMQGKRKYKRVFMGRIFGKMALRRLIKDDSPFPRGLPSAPGFKVTGNGIDVPSERSRWIVLVDDYGRLADDRFTHLFFGRMTRDQVGHLSYKHIDHHLRQFGC